MDRSDALGLKLNFVELRRHDIVVSISPEDLHRIGCKRNIAWIARFKRSLEDDNGVRKILVAFALDDVVLRIVLLNLLEL